MASDLVSSRLKLPIRPTTPIVTTTTAEATTHATKTLDNDGGGADNDDTPLILSQLIES